MNLVEAYKAGRAKTKWTSLGFYVGPGTMHNYGTKPQACAFGAIALGLGLDPKNAGSIIWGRPLRYFRDVTITYECGCKALKGYRDDPASVIEHYSDHHRRGKLGRDENLTAMLEKYGLKRPVKL